MSVAVPRHFHYTSYCFPAIPFVPPSSSAAAAPDHAMLSTSHQQFFQHNNLPSSPNTFTTNSDLSTPVSSLAATASNSTSPASAYSTSHPPTPCIPSIESDLPPTADFDLTLFGNLNTTNESTYPDPDNPLYMAELDAIYERAIQRIQDMQSEAREEAKLKIPSNPDASSSSDPCIRRKENNTRSMARTRLWRQVFTDRLQVDTEERFRRFKALRALVDKKYAYLRQVYSKLEEECHSICQTLTPSEFDQLPDTIHKMCLAFNLKPCLEQPHIPTVSPPPPPPPPLPIPLQQQPTQCSVASEECIADVPMPMSFQITPFVQPDSDGNVAYAVQNSKSDLFHMEDCSMISIVSSGVLKDPLDINLIIDPPIFDPCLNCLTSTPTIPEAGLHRGILDDVYNVGFDKMNIP